MHFALNFCVLALLALVRGNLNTETFKSDVQNGERVHLIEYFSPMCGSCKEFTPIFAEVCAKAQNYGVICEKVDIDTSEGMALAMEQHILAEGIPNVRVYHTKGTDSRGERIMVGDVKPAAEIISLIHKATHRLVKDPEGFYLKTSGAPSHEEL